MAVGLEGAHAEFVGQSEGLAVVGFGLLGLRRITTCGGLTEEPVGMRLVAASYEGAGELEEASGKRARLVYAADEEQGLAQLSEHERMVVGEDHAAPGGRALQRLVQEREGLHSTPGQGIRRTQEGGG